MTYLVTGGAGFIGSNLVAKLMASGAKVVVVDNLATGKKDNLKEHFASKHFHFYKKSICADLSAIFHQHKISGVFHLAALPRVQFSLAQPEKTHEANINGTFNLLNHCRQFAVKRLVFSSSSSVYGEQQKLPLVETMTPNPMSPYALQKLVGEEYCRLFHKIYGLETISLRYFNVFGPRQDPAGSYANLIPKFFQASLAKTRPTINGDGKQTRDFTFVSDVVSANFLAATTKNKECFGEVFNIGAGNRISVIEVSQIILQLSKSAAKPIHGPAVLEPKDTQADVSKASRLLKWRPEVDFKSGMKATYEYFKTA